MCRICGTATLSVPAPVGGVLNAIALWTVRGAVGVTVILSMCVAAVGLVVPLDWPRLMPRMFLLAVMPWVLYQTTLVLPGRMTRAYRPEDKR